MITQQSAHRSAGLIGALLVLGSIGLTPAAAGNSADLPVLGSTVITQQRDSTGVRAVALVHGVRRVPGATVLYFSVGLPAGSAKVDWVQLGRPQADRRYSTSSTDLGREQLIDVAGARVYSVLIDAQQNALASPREAWPYSGPAGQFYTMYEVLPELPAELGSVDVMIGNGDVIHQVPVSAGLMEPAVEQTGPLPLGQGWPKIDLAAARASVRPQDAVRPLVIESSDQKRTVTERTTDSGSVSVDLSADVLFTVDSAKLGGAAKAKIAAAAEQINSRAAAGQVRVVGYTDSTGSAAHGLELSKRRAQAVAKVLTPLVTVSGVTFAIAGEGERDPVASNATAAGRRANRRVSVVFTAKEVKR